LKNIFKGLLKRKGQKQQPQLLISNVKSVECNSKVRRIYKFIRKRLIQAEEKVRKRLKDQICNKCTLF
jgi:hypothetical protein